MKYLTKKYWKKFYKTVKLKDGTEKTIHDGAQFENLIEDVLKLMYQTQGVSWKRTKVTHDGNKDFLGKKKDGSLIWAECKSFENNISLKIIAPTLVMAEINDIQEILVFSYSAVNFQSKEKLLCYANKREKKIYYYDNDNLEKLLFRFRTNLFPQYFETFTEQISYPQTIDPYFFSCSMPGIHYNNAEIIGSSTFNVKLNEIIFVGIGIINNNFEEKLFVELSFKEKKDLDYMELLDSSVQNSTQSKWRQRAEINPGEAVFCKLYFRPVRFKNELHIPSIELNFNDSRLSNKLVKFQKITCNHLFSTPFIGGEYISAIRKLEDITINKGRMSLAVIYGKSGVGKSRFLQESISIYIKNHYHVLNFSANALAKDSFLMIREIIYFVYNFTSEMVIESLKQFSEDTTIGGSDQIEIIRLLQVLSDQNYTEFPKVLEKYKLLIFEKIFSQKNVFIIDNIQFADPFFVKFLYDLCIYGKTYQRNTQMVLVLSYNEDYYCCKAVKNIRLLAEEKINGLNTFIHEITGMKKNNLSLGFLKQLIHVADENDNLYLQTIVKKANNVPKHIENIVEYLLSKQILNIENNYFIITCPNLFYSVIDEIPTNFYEVFKLRFRLFLDKENVTEDSVLLIVSAIHFFSCITKEQIRTLRLNIEIVVKLEQYGFIDKVDTETFQFEHDLYEQFFIENYSLENNFIEYIIGENLFDQCNFIIWQKMLILLKLNDNIESTLSYIINKWCETSIEVPYKLKNYFYNQIINYLSVHYKIVKNFDKYMECVINLCLQAQNTLGAKVSEKLFTVIYNAIENLDIGERENFKGYQHFINAYSENLLQNEDVKALTIYNQRLKYLSQNPYKNYELLARVYNRIYVYHKHKKKEKTVHKYFEESMSLCDKYGLLGMKVENLYDEGNYYLFVPEKKEQLIKCWSQGYKIFKDNKKELSYLTLNSLKKKIQLQLLENNYEEIPDDLESAFEYLETGEYNQNVVFFKAGLYYLKAIYGLISRKLTLTEVQETLDNASKYYVLRNNTKPYTIHFLNAKLAYLKNEYQEMLCYYNYALQNLKKEHYYIDHIKKVIIDDCCYRIGLIKCKNNFQLDYTDIEKYLSNACQNIEQLSDIDCQEYVREFRSIANIVDESLQDGYLY